MTSGLSYKSFHTLTQFQYKRRTHFYETDAMGIIHHANYLLFFEEARLQFLAQMTGSQNGQNFLKDINYPLIHCEVDYNKPLNFNEEAVIHYDVETTKARLTFNYFLITKNFNKPLVSAKTVHVAFDMKRKKTIRLPAELFDFLSRRNFEYGSQSGS